MPAAHRHGDSRACGATTIVVGQSFCKVNGKLWSVNGDPDSHGAGALHAGGASFVKINGIPVIVVGDSAAPDNLCPPLGGAHCAPSATSGSPNTFAGGGAPAPGDGFTLSDGSKLGLSDGSTFGFI